MSWTRLLVVLIALALCACDDDKPAASGAAPTTTSAPSASPPIAPPAARAPTGVLSEEDFKALHQLKGADAPPSKGDMVALPSSKAYLSLPKGSQPPLAGIVVIHEWWGLNAHIKHWTDRLAEDGYAALAVDLYGGETATTPDEAMKMMKSVEDAAARKVLSEAFHFLAEDERIKADKRASIGWCFGGKWSLELALDQPELDAAVVYYGHVETDPVRLAELQASLLGIFGNQDTGIPPKMVDRFEFGLEQAGGKDYRILRYDANHAFANPSSERYDQPAAEKAWSEVRGFLRKHLSASAD